VTHTATHWAIADQAILPRPLQLPHPPLWSAAVSPESFAWAAKEDLGVLVGPFKPWPMVRHDIRHFERAAAGAARARVGLTLGILCLEDGERARRIARDAFTWFYRRLYDVTAPVLERLYPSYEQIHALGRFRKLLKLGIDLGFLETFGLAVAGTPEQCIRRLRRFKAAGVTRVLCAIGAGVVDAAVAEESMRLIAAKVAPAFARPDQRRPTLAGVR
jgi:alkanesulfonate monooxygenase SsuD/methylene tetrahydromethanopterin reductase-like flavin-dependent oxidoreductase (luciferase family)